MDCTIGKASEGLGPHCIDQGGISAPHTHFWLIKVWFSTRNLVVKITNFSKAQIPCTQF